MNNNSIARRNIANGLLVTGLVVSSITGFCGCTKNEVPVNVAVVSGYHNNSPVPAFTAATVTETLYEGAVSYGSYTFIIADGEPGSPAATVSCNIPVPSKNISATKREKQAQKYLQQAVDWLQTTKACSDEVDLYKAISLAGSSLSAMQGDKLLLILDSGLGTKGYVDFTNGILELEEDVAVDKILKYLEENQALTNDFEGVKVRWIGLGQVSGLQEQLTPKALNKLEAIWKSILLANGATEVAFITELSAAAAIDDDLPAVTPVAIASDDPLDLSGLLNGKAPLTFYEGEVLFLPDSATLADYDKAYKILMPLAELLNSNQDMAVVLAATTAQVGSNESCKTFSLSRAATVKDLLVNELGVAPKQIAATVGLGYEHRWHITDLNPDGSLNEEYAPFNRSVMVFNAESEDGQAVMQMK